LDRGRLADALRRALEGRLTVKEATALFDAHGVRGDAAAQRIAHEIVHFVDDADLRARDPQYDALQRRVLANHLTTMTD
jgi:hypothetical protein